MIERRRDVDWLRTFAVWMLFPFHVGKVYDSVPFYQIKAPDPSAFLSYVTGFVHVWHMPLFFLLAGWSVASSLKAGDSSSFVTGRLKRLGIPFLFVVAVFCPPMQYVHVTTAQGYSGSFAAFLSDFFSSLTYFNWSHVWFLIYLLTFTFLYLPLFQWVRRKNVAIGHAKLLLVPLPVLILSEILLRPIWPGWQNLVDDWANVVFYSTFFVLGFLLHRSEPAEAWIRQKRWFLLAAALVALLALLFSDMFLGWKHGLTRAAFASASYGCVLCLLGWARQTMSFREQGRAFWAEAAFPVYLLHQSSIVLPGSWIALQTDWPLALRFALSLGLAVSLTMALYLFVVRPFRVTRFLFGMTNPRLKETPKVG